MSTDSAQECKDEFVRETAKIRWSELLRFFAAGNAVFVDKSLDLVDVAVALRKDNASLLKQWMDSALVYVVKDEQAKIWLNNDELVWAVVVAPWVLIQKQRSTDENLPSLSK